MHMHAHGHSHSHHDPTQGHLRFGIFLNLGFAILELVVGFLSNSIAILTDSLHDFADSGSLLVAYIAAKISERPADLKRSFGYRRASILAALFNSSVLVVTTAIIFYHAIVRLSEPPEIRSGYMFLVAGLSILVNGAAVLRMRKDRHENLNLEGAFWHLLEDALGGVALLIGAIIIRLTQWYWVDSILSLLLGALVLRGALRVVLTSVHIFLEGTPKDIDPEEVEQALFQHPAVQEVHHMHLWMLDTQNYNMSVHVRIKNGEIPKGLYAALDQAVRRFKVKHLTVQVEGMDGDCLPCDECHATVPLNSHD